MPKTKLDRVLEILESQVQQNQLGDEVIPTTSEDNVQPQPMIQDVVSEPM